MSEFRTAAGGPARRRPRRAWVASAVAALSCGALVPVTIASASPSNAISNGTFTAGLKGWSAKKISQGQFAGYPKIAIGASTRPSWSWMAQCATFQGTKPFLSIDVPGGAIGYVQHQLTVPRAPGRLTFKTWGNLEPTTVTVSVVTGTVVHTLLTYSPPTVQGTGPSGCSGQGPAAKSISVAAFAGQKVGLRVQATSTGTDGTIADFDNFSLTGGSSPKPKPKPKSKPKSKPHHKPKPKSHRRPKPKSHRKPHPKPKPHPGGKDTIAVNGPTKNLFHTNFNESITGVATPPANYVISGEQLHPAGGCAKTYLTERTKSDWFQWPTGTGAVSGRFSLVARFFARNRHAHGICSYLVNRSTLKTYAHASLFWDNG